MWIGLLYAVLAIASQFQASGVECHESGLGSESLHSARLNFYREKVVQALVLANYTKCPPYTIETCILYFGTEFVRSVDDPFSMYLLVGLIVRMAFRMGYHREPSRFSNISPFKAELRRKTWLVILSLDLLSAATVGLPRTIQPFMYDTQEPRNLHDNDIYEDMVELPPSLPETELTPLLFAIVLTRVRTAQAKLTDLTNATSQPTYREIMDLDAELRQVYERIPDASKQVPADEMDTAEPQASMRRLYLGLSFMKALLMLHRPYVLLGRTDLKYDYSRRVCLNAAFEMLELQQKVDAEIRPGGKLWSPGWQTFTMGWQMSSVAAQDFYLATTVMLLELDGDQSCPLSPAPDLRTTGLKLDRTPPSRSQIIDILRGAQRIWYKASRRSREARKVAEAIRVVLNKANICDRVLVDTSMSKSRRCCGSYDRGT
jgi:hypothetical protein